jgi:amino acid permease
MSLASEKEKSTFDTVDVGLSKGSHDVDSLRHADDVLLAELGYKSEFKREFSVRVISYLPLTMSDAESTKLIELIAFSFSIMGVVASVTSTFSFPLVSGGHVGMVFGWLIPSLFVLTIAASMAELASSMP